MRFIHRFIHLIVLLVLISASGLSVIHADDPIHKPGNGEARLAAWSPDGKQIAVVSDASFSIYTATFEPVAAFELDDAITSLVWHPDSRQIATTDHARLVQLHDIPSGIVDTLHTADVDDDRYAGSVSFSPDGSLLASAHLDNTVRIWDVATRTLEKTLPLEAPAYAVAWHPGGKWLAVGSSVDTETHEGEAVTAASTQVWDVTTMQIVYRLDSSPFELFQDYAEIAAQPDFVPVRFLQWYAGGQRLLMHTSDFYDDRGWKIDTEDDSEPMNILAECGTTNDGAHFAPDGNWLAMGEAITGCSGSGTDTDDIWGIEVAAQQFRAWRTLYLGTRAIRDIAWHPNSQTIAVVTGEGTVVRATIDPTIYQDSFDAEIILDP